MWEIETKIRVNNLEVVRVRLKESGAEFVGRYVETNHILDSADGALRERGCGLRARSMEVIEGRPASPTLTFKGPARASTMKRREEIETTITDLDVTLRILREIGFPLVVGYRKRRERWTLDGCCVELDEVPLLGTFVEIEGPSEDAVRATRDRLQLARQPHVKPSYVRMLVERCRELGRSATDIDFESS